jgi:hypothetical protein
VLSRAYCRNLKTKEGEPFGLIRLEAEQRFDPKEALVSRVHQAEFVASVWRSRYGEISGTVRRLAREVQAMEIHERVKAGEVTYQQGERLSMFLDLERLGIAQSYYPLSVYRQRRREAAKLGYACNEMRCQPLEADLDDLLHAYRGAVDSGVLE